jgi:uncharacterized protein with HEPN domain
MSDTKRSQLHYFEVDIEAVWDTIEKNIPILKKHIQHAYESEK